MPRARIVKQEFLADERLAGLSPPARLMILGAASLADKMGILENRPLRIKVASMPHDTMDLDSVMGELFSSGIFLLNEDRRLIKIGPWDDWFSGFPNEPKDHETEVFSRGTVVEQMEASPMLGGSMPHASNKYKVKAKVKEKKESLFPIRDSMDPELMDWYLEAVDAYPTRDEGHNARSGQIDSRKVQRDSPQAQKNFIALVESGAVTARELYVCAWLAAGHWSRQRDSYNYIPNLSSFFSHGEKAPWATWIEDARKAIAEQEVKP